MFGRKTVNKRNIPPVIYLFSRNFAVLRSRSLSLFLSVLSSLPLSQLSRYRSYHLPHQSVRQCQSDTREIDWNEISGLEWTNNSESAHIIFRMDVFAENFPYPKWTLFTHTQTASQKASMWQSPAQNRFCGNIIFSYDLSSVRKGWGVGENMDIWMARDIWLHAKVLLSTHFIWEPFNGNHKIVHSSKNRKCDLPWRPCAFSAYSERVKA